MTQKDDDGDNYVHYEGDPTNRTWTAYGVQNLTFKEHNKDVDGGGWYYDYVDDTEMTYPAPLKLTVDLTNNTNGTTEEVETGKYFVNCKSGSTQRASSSAWLSGVYTDGDVTEKTMLFQFYEKAQDGDKIVQGTNKIAWSADNRHGIALKSNAYLMAVVFVCGDENAETEVIRMKAEDETGISNVVAEGAAKSNEMYNLAGQRISAPVSGQIYIVNGKKYIAK